MANDEMIWDETAGKLVPKAGFRKTDEQPSSSGEPERKLTKKMTARADAAAIPPANVATDSAPLADVPPATSSPAAETSPGTPAPSRRSRAASPDPDEELTVAHGATDSEDETAGWLAFLSGNTKGGFSVVRTGQNAIGRGPDNHIIIEGERSVSRVAAAFIIVDPADQAVHLRPGLGSSIVRVNGDLITNSHVLAADDHIQIGDVSCAFVPFPAGITPGDGA